MIDYPLSELQNGKYFSESAYLDENYILLSPETPVDSVLLKRLKEWDFDHIYSEGSVVESQVTIVTQDDDTVSGNLNLRLKERADLNVAEGHYSSLVQFIELIFDNYSRTSLIGYDQVNEKIKVFVQRVKELRNSLLRFNEFNAHPNYLIEHSARSAIIGIVYGIDLRWPPHKLIDIGTICLLHEIGMTKIPDKLYMSDNLLNEKERRTVATHPVLGYRALRDARFSASVCMAVLEHHENIDGSGYPQGLKFEHLSEYGKIVSIISSYVAMTSDRPFRLAKDGYSVLIAMLKKRGVIYDAEIMAQFLKTVSVYPVGTYVRVKSGAEGIVIETSPDKPKSPLVRLILGPLGERYRESPMVSTTNPDYQIASIIPPSKAAHLKAYRKS